MSGLQVSQQVCLGVKLIDKSFLAQLISTWPRNQNCLEFKSFKDVAFFFLSHDAKTFLFYFHFLVLSRGTDISISDSPFVQKCPFIFMSVPLLTMSHLEVKKKGISPHNILTCYERPFQGVQLKEEIKITARKPSI